MTKVGGDGVEAANETERVEVWLLGIEMRSRKRRRGGRKPEDKGQERASCWVWKGCLAPTLRWGEKGRMDCGEWFAGSHPSTSFGASFLPKRYLELGKG